MNILTATSQLSELIRHSPSNQSSPQLNSFNLDSESPATTPDEFLYPGDGLEDAQGKLLLFSEYVSLPGDGGNVPPVNTDANFLNNQKSCGLYPVYINNTLPNGRPASQGSCSSSPMTPVPSLISNNSSPYTYYSSFPTTPLLTPSTPTPSIPSGSHFIGDLSVQGYNIDLGQLNLQHEPAFLMDVDTLPCSNAVQPNHQPPHPLFQSLLDFQLASTQPQQQHNAAQTQECPSIHTRWLEGSHQQTLSAELQQQAEQLQKYQQQLSSQHLQACQQLQRVEPLEFWGPQQLEQHSQTHSHVVNERQQAQDFLQPIYTNHMNQVLLNAPSFSQAPVSHVLEPLQNTAGMPPPTSSDEVLPSASRPNSASSSFKRQRKSLTLEEKFEIINFKTLNPSISVQELSKKIGVPRSTIYGIFDNKEKITELARSQPNLSRVVENRFRILEALLIDWNHIQETRGIKISTKKLCAQAFEVHRMLSGLLSEPLPQCLFTTGWHKGFKERRAAYFETATISQEPPRLDEIKNLISKLEGISKDNIYSCDITNMYLDMMPTSIYKDEDPSRPSRRTDSSSVSTLLCCNADGTDMLEPVVLVRQTSNAMGLQGYDGVVLDSDLKNVTSRVVWSWLTRFDRDIGHKVVLLVDQAMYDLFELEKGSGQALLRFVTVLCVPRNLEPFLPMNARVIKDFKSYYYTLLLKSSPEWYRNLESQRVALEASQPNKERSLVRSSQPCTVCPLNTIVSQLRIIPNAWLHVSTSVVENDFQYFLNVAKDLAGGDRPRNISRVGDTDSPEGRLKETLAIIYPGLPSSVAQYYLTLGNEIGPSCFLRTRILEMRHHVDFQGCFGDILNFGTVWYGSRKLESSVRFESTKQKQMAHKESDLLKEYSLSNFPFGGTPRHTREESSEVVMYGPQRSSTCGR